MAWSHYSQFFEVVNLVYNNNLHVNDVIEKVIMILQANNFKLIDAYKQKKFITGQLNLHNKSFCIVDYCFAISKSCSPSLLLSTINVFHYRKKVLLDSFIIVF